jgi:pantoate--beta-alanine ligase
MRKLALAWKRAGVKVALVPTMGALHLGHLSLVQQARRRVGPRGIVVVSIYVNPTQFGPKEDLARYPRDLPRDSALCEAKGTDVLFIPNDVEMYPGRGTLGGFSTYVCEESLSQGMEGASRPTHFRGVTTVVSKLFLLVLPDIAIFGAKDFQQAAVIRHMVRDLAFPVSVVISPTIRERDGLALSSRNRYLSTEERQQATVLSCALQEARSRVRNNAAGVSANTLRGIVNRMIYTRPAARLDYVQFFDPHTLQPLRHVKPGAQMALAVFVGKTRLIDNGRL